MRWFVKQCDILDETADVLVCSANPYLTLSGGVGGAFLLRYGDSMQRQLQEYLSANSLRFADRGSVILMPPCGSPYKAVLHAVGVNAFYETSSDVVTSVVNQCLQLAGELSASKIALAAIATGYGRLPLDEFANGLTPIMDTDFMPIQEVVICLRKRDDVIQLSELLPLATMVQ